MILFFDTSALVKFFHDEDGTEAATRIERKRIEKYNLLEECD